MCRPASAALARWGTPRQNSHPLPTCEPPSFPPLPRSAIQRIPFHECQRNPQRAHYNRTIPGATSTCPTIRGLDYSSSFGVFRHRCDCKSVEPTQPKSKFAFILFPDQPLRSLKNTEQKLHPTPLQQGCTSQMSGSAYRLANFCRPCRSPRIRHSPQSQRNSAV